MYLFIYIYIYIYIFFFLIFAKLYVNDTSVVAIYLIFLLLYILIKGSEMFSRRLITLTTSPRGSQVSVL